MLEQFYKLLLDLSLPSAGKVSSYFIYSFKEMDLADKSPGSTANRPWTSGGLLNMRPLGVTFLPGATMAETPRAAAWGRDSQSAMSIRTTVCYISQCPVIQDLP